MTLCIITAQARHQIKFPYVAMKWLIADLLTRAQITPNTRITNIFGQKRVEGIELTALNGRTERVECDTVIFTGDWIPEHELARLGGLTFSSVTQGPEVDAGFRTSTPGVFAAGNLLRGVLTAGRCALEGRRAAQSIARFLKH